MTKLATKLIKHLFEFDNFYDFLVKFSICHGKFSNSAPKLLQFLVAKKCQNMLVNQLCKLTVYTFSNKSAMSLCRMDKT